MPGGEANFSTTTAAGTTVAFDDDFDLKSKWGFGVRYTFRSPNGKHKLWATYARTSASNTRTLSRTFVFLGQTYPVNLDTRSDTSLGIFLASYAYRWGSKKIRIGPMAQVGWATARVELAAVTNTTIADRSGSISALAGTVGYDMDINPSDKFNIFNNVGFMALGKQRFIRGELGLRYYITRNFGVSGGYQFGKYKLTNNDNYIQANESGPFVGGLVRF
ncbi:MAG: hypothetical protein ABI481_06910 [Pyrinomonadaceae bacterium]